MSLTVLYVSTLPLFQRFFEWVLELLRQSGIFIMLFIKPYTSEGTFDKVVYLSCYLLNPILLKAPSTKWYIYHAIY